MKDYHDILDVSTNATQEQIKFQYRQLVRIYHPDRFTNPIDKVFAEEKLKEINEAYNALATHKGEQTYADTATEGPPKPVIEPMWLDFGLVNPGAKVVQSFKVDNLGGPVKQIDFLYADHNHWFEINNGRPVTKGKAMPVLFDVTVDVRKLPREQVHHAWAELDMDGVRTRLNLTVRVAPPQPVFPFSSRLMLSVALCGVIVVALFLFQFSVGLPLITNALHSSDSASFARRLQGDHLLFSVIENNQPMIYFAQTDGADQLGLGLNGWSPALAPNGRQLAYVAAQKGVAQIFVSDVDGRHLRQVTMGLEPKSSPAWSPDGRMLAFIVGPDEQAILRVFDIQVNQFYDLPYANLGVVKQFDWSPDSRTLSFDAYQGNSSKIYQSNPTGQNIQLFTTFDSRDPAWSPDGKNVALASPQGIYLVDKQGRDLRHLNLMPAWSPTWSYDGSQIAFLSDQSATKASPDLWVMDADGHNPRRVTGSGVQDFAWSPSSKHLAYITGNPQDREPILYLWVTDLEKQAQLVAEVNKTYVAWTR